VRVPPQAVTLWCRRWLGRNRSMERVPRTGLRCGRWSLRTELRWYPLSHKECTPHARYSFSDTSSRARLLEFVRLSRGFSPARTSTHEHWFGRGALAEYCVTRGPPELDIPQAEAAEPRESCLPCHWCPYCPGRTISARSRLQRGSSCWFMRSGASGIVAIQSPERRGSLLYNMSAVNAAF